MNRRSYGKYLAKCRFLPVEPRPLPENTFQDFVVIPACDELDFLPATLDSLPDDGRVGVLVVLNYPEGAGAELAETTAKTAELLRLRRDPRLFWIFAPELNGGAGAARKLGMDIVARAAAGTPDETLIFSLDADTLTGPEYFSAVREFMKNSPGTGALTLGFCHQPSGDPQLERAVREYETYLRRYAGKLKECGSPYGFCPVGSAFAVRVSAYVKAGGMRVRCGGEDFYFLQAAAKTGRVDELERTLVYPSPRLSGRVPFGTGPSLRKIVSGEGLNPVSDRAFEALRPVLAAATEENLRTPESFTGQLSEVAGEFFAAEGFAADWRRVLNNLPASSSRARERAFHIYFDGLRTLRFLHHADAR